MTKIQIIIYLSFIAQFASENHILKFRLEDIPREGRVAEVEQDPTWLDERLGGGEKNSVRFLGPIRIHLKLSRLGSTVLASSRVRVEMEFQCDRCLESFSSFLDSEYKASLKPKPRIPAEEKAESQRDDDPETEFYEGEEIDLTPLIQDQILLALPPKAVCREDCRGLCPRCGQNLNRGTCQCADQDVDPRLQPLKNFRV